MKMHEEIIKALECCSKSEGCVDCVDLECPYVVRYGCDCMNIMAADALKYIQTLEKERDESQRLFAKTYDEMEEANKRLDGKENCTNCAYGNGTITEMSYCYDCKWFTDEATKIKWTEGKHDD